MSESPEALVGRFFAAWADPQLDELAAFFDESAVWVDGPQGVHHGVDAIKAELTRQLTAVGGVTVTLKTVVRDGPTVMVEQEHTFSMNGHDVFTVVMAVFEVGTSGKIVQWREAYDLGSVADQIEIATRQKL